MSASESVVLPQPDSPNMPILSPGKILKLTEFRTGTHAPPACNASTQRFSTPRSSEESVRHSGAWCAAAAIDSVCVVGEITILSREAILSSWLFFAGRKTLVTNDVVTLRRNRKAHRHEVPRRSTFDRSLERSRTCGLAFN
jgi:hypothetical protein